MKSATWKCSLVVQLLVRVRCCCSCLGSSLVLRYLECHGSCVHMHVCVCMYIWGIQYTQPNRSWPGILDSAGRLCLALSAWHNMHNWGLNRKTEERKKMRVVYCPKHFDETWSMTAWSMKVLLYHLMLYLLNECIDHLIEYIQLLTWVAFW